MSRFKLVGTDPAIDMSDVTSDSRMSIEDGASFILNEADKAGIPLALYIKDSETKTFKPVTNRNYDLEETLIAEGYSEESITSSNIM